MSLTRLSKLFRPHGKNDKCCNGKEGRFRKSAGGVRRKNLLDSRIREGWRGRTIFSALSAYSKEVMLIIVPGFPLCRFNLRCLPLLTHMSYTLEMIFDLWMCCSQQVIRHYSMDEVEACPFKHQTLRPRNIWPTHRSAQNPPFEGLSSSIVSLISLEMHPTGPPPRQ